MKSKFLLLYFKLYNSKSFRSHNIVNLVSISFSLTHSLLKKNTHPPKKNHPKCFPFSILTCRNFPEFTIKPLIAYELHSIHVFESFSFSFINFISLQHTVIKTNWKHNHLGSISFKGFSSMWRGRGLISRNIAECREHEYNVAIDSVIKK